MGFTHLQDAYSIYSLTDEDKAAILTLAKDPNIGEKRAQGLSCLRWLVCSSRPSLLP